MFHRIARVLVAGAAACLVTAVAAPSTALAQRAIPVSEALAGEVEVYKFFTVVGTIVDTKGQGLYRIEDESGRMPIVIKDHIVREHGEIKKGDRVQVWGRFEQKKLDTDVQGMMVARLHRLEADSGASGADNPGADLTPPTPTTRTSDAQVAPAAIDDANVMRPKTSEDYKLRARAALKAYRQAETDAVDAGQVYARAAREAGSDGQVDAAVLERLQAAEAKVVETRGEIPALVNEARAAGVDDSVIRMIEMEAGIR